MYDTERWECNMAYMPNGDRRFPPEAYEYDDDVTPEAVDMVRQKAAKLVEAEHWEVVDGFGANEPA
jgi:hypothetical protein